ncbi:hypothetical protein ACHWQZ_G011380 [Mnemiopsis leidyi]
MLTLVTLLVLGHTALTDVTKSPPNDPIYIHGTSPELKLTCTYTKSDAETLVDNKWSDTLGTDTDQLNQAFVSTTDTDTTKKQIATYPADFIKTSGDITYSLVIADGRESNVGSYKCQIPGVTQSTDSVNVYFTKQLTFSPSTNPIYHHNTAAQISFTCTYTKAGKETLADIKWSDTLGTDSDQLNQAFVSTTDTDTTKKQVAAYPANFLTTSGDITCLFKYSFSGALHTFTHTFQVKVEPISISSPLVVVEEEGSTVTLVCSVKTVSSTTLTWRKDDTTDIPGVSSFSTDTSTLSNSLEIADGRESNVGSYKCQIPGVTQSTDSVNVYFTKQLTLSPSTNPIYHHNTAAQISFTCTYTKAGKETLADIKWSDTLGTDTDQLNQAFVSTTDTDTTKKQVATYPANFLTTSGDITCLFKYSFSGAQHTFTHTFQVKVEPISISPPLVVVEEEGSTVTLACSVKTVSSTTLTWRKDDTTDIPGDSSFSTDTSTLSNSLVIADGRESNVGSYKCQIPGVTQSTDSVNVYFTKQLTFSPSTNPIYHHNTAAQISFTCTYTKAGKETLADIKWSDTLGTDTDQLNQAFVSTTDTDTTKTQVATYPANFLTTSGDITCLFKYSFSGALHTFTHTFQVKVEPISISSPLVVVEEEGSTVTLACSVKTVSSTTLTWRKDDTTDIPGVSSFSTDNSTLSNSLVIADGRESNVGSYKCQIPGVTQSTDSVNVYFTKQLTFSPSTNPIYHHNTAAQISFTCTYTKAGKETLADIKWSDTLGTDSDQLNQAFVSTTDTDTTKKQVATYPASAAKSAGNVTCTFKYSFGELLKTFDHTFQISIQEPVISPSPRLLAEMTKTATLTCTVKTLPDTDLYWKFGSTTLATEITTSYDVKTAVKTSVLRLNNVSESNSGIYMCGAVGYDATGATLVIVHSGIQRSVEKTLIIETGATVSSYCSLTVYESEDIQISWKVETNQTNNETVIGNSTVVNGKLNSTVEIKKVSEPYKLTCTFTVSAMNISAEITIQPLDRDITCPALDSGGGTLTCSQETSPISCTYRCPEDMYLLSEGDLVSFKTVTCDSDNAQWSHVSPSNPLGIFPSCTEKVTPKSYSLNATLKFFGATQCADSVSFGSALSAALKASTSTAYSCMDTGDCSINSDSITCTSSAEGLQVKLVVVQTGGELSSPQTMINFKSQLENETSLQLSVDDGSRRRALVTLTLSKTETTQINTDCAAGQQVVNLSCVVCGVGWYETGGVCQECPRNSFSTLPGSTKCTPCPGDLKTPSAGSDSETDCTAECVVQEISGGYRSPASGYTVTPDTTINTFCNSGYDLQTNVSGSYKCGDLDQPTCYKQCAITKSSSGAEFPKLAITALSYGAELNFTCPDEGVTSVKCAEPGSALLVACQEGSISTDYIVIGVVGGLVFLGIIITITVIYRKNRSRSRKTSPVIHVLPA